MPRTARLKAASGIYHVVIRGADRQIIFEERDDYLKYLDLLSYYKEQSSFSLYAYCLMSNHIHLIIKTGDIPLRKIFQQLNTAYAVWFNMKYQRTGHLQQDRYHSEPIDDKNYLLTAIRYVHQNPLKAGLENSPGTSYPWNSLSEYIENHYDLVDSDFIYSLISRNDFIEYNNHLNDDTCLDISHPKPRMPDDVAKNILLSISKCETCSEFANIQMLNQKKYLQEAHERGVSIRQLNRLTHLSLGAITRLLNH